MEYCLADRALIKLEGSEVVPFLQGLITADATPLEHGERIFTTMLSANGKLTHEFHIHPQDGAFYVDVATSHAEALLKKFKIYKMRSDVALSRDDDAFSVLHTEEGRSLVAKRTDDDSAAYHAWRVQQALPDAAHDTTDRSFVLDLGYDALGAVDFDKGCYVGQEVTARMHYKNARRRAIFAVQALEGDTLPALGTEILAGEAKLGEIRSSVGKFGIAICRWEEVAKAGDAAISCAQTTVSLSVPEWFAQTYQRIITPKEAAS